MLMQKGRQAGKAQAQEEIKSQTYKLKSKSITKNESKTPNTFETIKDLRKVTEDFTTLRSRPSPLKVIHSTTNS